MNSQLDMVSKTYDSRDLKITVQRVTPCGFDVEFFFKTTKHRVQITDLSVSELCKRLSNVLIMNASRGLVVDISDEKFMFIADEVGNVVEIKNCILSPCIPERFFEGFILHPKVLQLTCN